jgi:hypothetical protein
VTEHPLSSEAVERLRAWALAHCPDPLRDPAFLPALVAAVAEAVSEELGRACWLRRRQLREPCQLGPTLTLKDPS